MYGGHASAAGDFEALHSLGGKRGVCHAGTGGGRGTKQTILKRKVGSGSTAPGERSGKTGERQQNAAANKSKCIRFNRDQQLLKKNSIGSTIGGDSQKGPSEKEPDDVLTGRAPISGVESEKKGKAKMITPQDIHRCGKRPGKGGLPS